jgi:hypothetical protein
MGALQVSPPKFHVYFLFPNQAICPTYFSILDFSILTMPHDLYKSQQYSLCNTIYYSFISLIQSNTWGSQVRPPQRRSNWWAGFCWGAGRCRLEGTQEIPSERCSCQYHLCTSRHAASVQQVNVLMSSLPQNGLAAGHMTCVRNVLLCAINCLSDTYWLLGSWS